MSWFARSIANSLKFDEEEEDDNTNETKPENQSKNHEKPIQSPSMSSSPTLSPSESQLPRGGGVKEDLSEITKTLTRQFWGVASFLAPPPQIAGEDKSPPADLEPAEPAGIDGIRSDFAEIGGKFRTGISKLSGNIGVSEISKMASNFLQFGSDESDDWARNVVGVTDEVLAFVKNVSLHPETWLDFPLPDDDEDADDFDMSDAQQEHALAVERLVPELAALRFELCPEHVSEGHFWKIYFVLVHPRLDKQAAEFLSTPQIVEARAMLTQELHNRNKAKPEPARDASSTKEDGISSREESLSVSSGAQTEAVPFKTSAPESAPATAAAGLEIGKHPDYITEIEIVDKSVVKEEAPVNPIEHHKHPSAAMSKVFEDKDEDDGDDWLKEETSEVVGTSDINIPIISNDEDVSFSDLEEEEDEGVPTGYVKDIYASDSSTKDSRDWVQLSRSSSDSAKDNRS